MTGARGPFAPGLLRVRTKRPLTARDKIDNACRCHSPAVVCRELHGSAPLVRAAVGRRRLPTNPGGRPGPRLSSAIPSTWRSPTARSPAGSPRRNRRPTSPSSARGRPCGSPPGGRRDGTLLILETCPPGEGALQQSDRKTEPWGVGLFSLETRATLCPRSDGRRLPYTLRHLHPHRQLGKYRLRCNEASKGMICRKTIGSSD